jgi:hypothetical protein
MRDSIDEQPEQKKFVFAYSLLLPGTRLLFGV